MINLPIKLCCAYSTLSAFVARSSQATSTYKSSYNFTYYTELHRCKLGIRSHILRVCKDTGCLLQKLLVGLNPMKTTLSRMCSKRTCIVVPSYRKPFCAITRYRHMPQVLKQTSFWPYTLYLISTR